MVYGALDATWASRVPFISEQLRLGDLGLSVALAGPPVGLILAARLAMPIVGRFGNMNSARGAALLSSAGLMLPALAWNLITLTAGLVIWGACMGVLDITMNTQGSVLERDHGRSLMSGLHASYSIAALAFAALGGLASHLAIPPLPHFAVIAAAFWRPSLGCR